MKRPHKTEVSITARRPEPVTVDKWYQPLSEPVALERVLIEAAPLIRKAKQNAENRKRAVKHLNESERQSAQQKKSKALKIADGLRRLKPELRLSRKISALARDIKAEWRPREEAPAFHTIRHWLTENK